MSTEEHPYSMEALLLRWMSDEEQDALSLGRLQDWVNDSPQNKLLLDLLQDDRWLATELDQMDQVDSLQPWQRLQQRLKQPASPKSAARELPSRKHTPERSTPGIQQAPRQSTPFRKLRPYAICIAAALILIVADLGINQWWNTLRRQNPITLHTKPTHWQIPLNKDAREPTLTLMDGSVLLLGRQDHPSIPRQGNSRIIEGEGHRLLYLPPENLGADNPPAAGKEAYNTLTLPHGLQYELTLGDGSRIWLNDGSSLRYPVVFGGWPRELELQGEAYFEVRKFAGMPFTVRTTSLLTEVLGTHFNIRDYPDEGAPRTTLLEGKVAVSSANTSRVLDRSGQEAAFVNESAALQTTSVDLDSRLAWKSGYFCFDSVDIRASMGEVARWYGKKLVFKDNAAQARLGSGRAKRDQPLSQLLKHIERADLHFQEDDSTITINR